MAHETTQGSEDKQNSIDRGANTKNELRAGFTPSDLLEMLEAQKQRIEKYEKASQLGQGVHAAHDRGLWSDYGEMSEHVCGKLG
jgi:hypothetical protein